MKKFIYIDHHKEGVWLEGLPYSAMAMPLTALKTNAMPFLRDCEASLLSIDGLSDEQENRMLQAIATDFPGADIYLLSAEKVGTVPPGKFTSKQITKDGVLPA